ncbi:MAG: SDR family NAD(P)-dependent oxidoreductase, partial [Saezia sp.]
RGLAGHGAYCSSKAAVISYCESLRLEMYHATGARGVSVLTVLPGFVATPLTQHNPYEMPFMLTAQEFAKRAVRVIDENKSYAVIPWQMGLVARGLRVMPNFLFDRLFSGRKRKLRDQEGS